MSNYYSIITQRGLEKLTSSQTNGTAIKLKAIAVGDASGNDDAVPDINQITLINEVYRAEINRLFTHESDKNILVAELHIPSNVGGFIIREAGIFDEDGELFAVGRYPATVKPKLEDGTAREEILQLAIAHANNEAIELKIDPSIVMASRAYVDKQITESHMHYEDRELIHVGSKGDFTDLQSAWDSVKGKRLKKPLVFQIEDGEYNVKKPLVFNDAPMGFSITIQGNPNDEKAVQFLASYDSDAILFLFIKAPDIQINNVTFIEKKRNKTAIFGIQSNILSQQGLVINGFRVGVFAKDETTFTSKNTKTIHCTYGFYSQNYSRLNLQGATMEGDHKSISQYEPLNMGVFCENTSTATLTQCLAKNKSHAFYASFNSFLRLHNTVCEKSYIGFCATANSSISSSDCSVKNSLYGIYISDNSYGAFYKPNVYSCTYGCTAVLASLLRLQSPSVHKSTRPFCPEGNGLIGNFNSMTYTY